MSLHDGLTGEGPTLTVYSLQPQPKARASRCILRHHRIHGIRPRSLVAGPAKTSATGNQREESDEEHVHVCSRLHCFVLRGCFVVQLDGLINIDPNHRFDGYFTITIQIMKT